MLCVKKYLTKNAGFLNIFNILTAQKDKEYTCLKLLCTFTNAQGNKTGKNERFKHKPVQTPSCINNGSAL